MCVHIQGLRQCPPISFLWQSQGSLLKATSAVPSRESCEFGVGLLSQRGRPTGQAEGMELALGCCGTCWN